jgi:hypothetical protein
MTPDAEGFLDEGPPKGLALERMKELSLGAKLVLASGLLLFFSLFLTWQNLEIDYGRAGTGTLMLDGWDATGLAIGFLTLGLIALVMVVRVSDVDVSPDIAWEFVTLVLASTILGLVVLKNLTDKDSAWPSYFALAVAAAIVAGAYLDWSSSRPGPASLARRRRRRIRRVA